MQAQHSEVCTERYHSFAILSYFLDHLRSFYHVQTGCDTRKQVMKAVVRPLTGSVLPILIGVLRRCDDNLDAA